MQDLVCVYCVFACLYVCVMFELLVWVILGIFFLYAFILLTPTIVCATPELVKNRVSHKNTWNYTYTE